MECSSMSGHFGRCYRHSAQTTKELTLACGSLGLRYLFYRRTRCLDNGDPALLDTHGNHDGLALRLSGFDSS